MPRGVEYKIPLRDLLDAHQAHMAGWSIRVLARMNYERWGYASEKSAVEGLRNAFKASDLPVRNRIEATVLASTVHGHNRRGMKQPGHPDHAEHLAHRRWLRAQKRAA